MRLSCLRALRTVPILPVAAVAAALLLAACGDNRRAPACGDGVVDTGETCDDGNRVDNDGCSAACRVESCGDGVVQAAEACDGADLEGESCESRGFASGTLGCAACAFDESGCVAHRCGDGILGPGEACDDGNHDDNDGCDHACHVESCGDGVVQTGEACDGADLEGATCEARGYASGTLACDASCGFDDSGCVAHRCGDGILGPGEACDDGNDDDNDGCSHDCRIERCGDGITQTGEQCDDGGTADGDGCSATCQTELGWSCSGAPSTCTVPSCGNGDLESAFDEECDDGNLVDGDGCSSTCRFELTCATGETAVHVRGHDLALAIPDNNPAGVQTSLHLPLAGGLRALRVGIGRLDHTFLGDVEISLVSPGGAVRRLVNSSNNAGDNFRAALFADAGTATVGNSTSAPVHGLFAPVDSLSKRASIDLLNQEASGDWTLALVDTFQGDTGTLDSWTLLACVDPGAVCGDGDQTGTEQCDDGDAVAGDGCTTCHLDVCGDGVVNDGGTEACDDGNTVDGDGCEGDCTLACGAGLPGIAGAVEDATSGHCYAAFASPAITWANAELACEADGGYLVVPDSADENTLARLARPNEGVWIGLDDITEEAGTTAANFRRVTGGIVGTGYQDFATGEPNNSGNEDCAQYNGTDVAWNDLPCTNTLAAYICELEPQPCGDGVLQTVAGEQCDDGNTADGDGCSSTCQVEADTFCRSQSPALGYPSACQAIGCGDGNVEAGEQCDDGGTVAGDGCSAACTVESGYACAGTTPSVCAPTCGDGIVAGNETCDDGNVDSGDGCSSTCRLEGGFDCSATTPTVCTSICGDGLVRGAEECDDANATDGDGCTSCRFDFACDPTDTLVRVRSTDVPKAIPDNTVAGVSSALSVTDVGSVSKLAVGIGQISHTYNDDLDLTLIGPSGISRDLSSDNGGNADGYLSVDLADGYATSISSLDTVNTVIRGAYRPEQSLSSSAGVDFLGQSSNGTWSLHAVDDAQVDTGSIDAWTLLLCVHPST
ncbi:MAG TPA: DUF4215 domain-containing protein [Kofleriaceae bacterium]|nr:DUF4215 domain-containing protein [Kofleriaceae bacterium]